MAHSWRATRNWPWICRTEIEQSDHRPSRLCSLRSLIRFLLIERLGLDIIRCHTAVRFGRCAARTHLAASIGRNWCAQVTWPSEWSTNVRLKWIVLNCDCRVSRCDCRAKNNARWLHCDWYAPRRQDAVRSDSDQSDDCANDHVSGWQISRDRGRATCSVTSYRFRLTNDWRLMNLEFPDVGLASERARTCNYQDQYRCI